MAKKWVITAAVLALGAGCQQQDSYIDISPNAAGKGDHNGFHGVSHEIDILFVVDSSGSMAEEQENLRRNLPALLNSLRNEELGPDKSGNPCNAIDRSGCEIPSVHIGVVSADLGAGAYSSLPSCEVIGGDAGRLIAQPGISGCATPSDDFIWYENGKSNVAGPGDEIKKVVEAFGCISALGTSGCGFEQQLEAARRALDGTTNPGFLRPDALLAVVFLTDEDDCSAANTALFDPLSDYPGPLSSFRCFEFGVHCSVNDRNRFGPRQDCYPASNGWMHDVQTRYVDFFRSLKPPGDVVLAALAGPTDRVEVGSEYGMPVLQPSCMSSAGAAAPAIRLKAVIDAFGTDGVFSSICDSEYGPPLKALGQVLSQKL